MPANVAKDAKKKVLFSLATLDDYLDEYHDKEEGEETPFNLFKDDIFDDEHENCQTFDLQKGRS